MRQFKILFACLLCICLSVSCSDSDETIVYSTPLRTIITGMDYGDGVLVVGHKSPDCDAVLSAMTYASLLQRMGINAEARTSFDGMTDEDILFSDYKEYEIEGYKVGIGNVFASDELGVEELCQRMRQIMPAVRAQQGLDMLFMMLGDRQANVTHIPFCGDGAREAAEAGFGASANSFLSSFGGVGGGWLHRHHLHLQSQGSVPARYHRRNKTDNI